MWIYYFFDGFEYTCDKIDEREIDKLVRIHGSVVVMKRVDGV